ncbi:MAG: rod shape-determining protein MreC [bacterium]|nr:rod shape-determining protein MreC [bacterium]
MTYLRRSNVGEKKGRAVTIAIILAIVALVSIDFIFPSFYPRLLSPVASTAWKSEDAVIGIFGRMARIVSSKLALVRENASLRDEVRSREADAFLLQTLRDENEALKTALGRESRSSGVLGVVLSRPPVSAYDTLTLDVGSDDGIAVGQRVYINGSILVGDISEVTGASSKTSLYSTPGRETPVLIGDKKVAAQAVGRGGGNFIARLPTDIEVAVGDIIVAPQLRVNIFGVVEHISVGATDSIQAIYFRAPFNMQELRYVEVDAAR